MQNLRGKGLDRGALARVNPVGGPNEEAEHESGQQCDQTYDRADHVLAAAGHVFLGQNAVQDETEGPAGKHGDL